LNSRGLGSIGPRGGRGLVGAPHEAPEITPEGSPVAAHPVARGIAGTLRGGSGHGGKGGKDGEGGEKGGHDGVWSLFLSSLDTPR